MMELIKKRGYDGSVRVVMDNAVACGIVGTVEDLLHKRVLECCDAPGETWCFLPFVGDPPEAQFAGSREEVLLNARGVGRAPGEGEKRRQK